MIKLKLNPLARIFYIVMSRSFISSKLLIQLSDSFRKAAEFRIIQENNGKHPKHEIIRYYEFFQNNLDKNDVVIDIGSSKGELTKKISVKVKEVIGVEIVKQNYLKAMELNSGPNIKFENADIFKYEIPNEVNVAVMSNVLEHLNNRIELLTILRKKCRKLLIRVPAIEREWWPVYLKQKGFEYRLDYTHFIEHSLNEIKLEVESAGWNIQAIDCKWGEYYIACD